MAKDIYHNLVKQALEDDGWKITHDPFFLEAGSRSLRIDLGAEQLLGAEREDQKIAVEIKSFVGISALHDFYKAVGQFDYYLFSLNKQERTRKLFLAVPEDFYIEFIEQDLHNFSYIQSRKLNIIVFNIPEKIITKWISLDE